MLRRRGGSGGVDHPDVPAGSTGATLTQDVALKGKASSSAPTTAIATPVDVISPCILLVFSIVTRMMWLSHPTGVV